jgi:hypothetical protein
MHNTIIIRPRSDIMTRTNTLITILSLSLSIPALAAYGPKPAGNKSGQNNRNNANNQLPAKQKVTIPAIDSSGLNAAKKDAAAAKAEEKKAQNAYNQLRAKLEKGFDDKPESADATKKVTSTKAAYDAAAAPILKSLESSPDYKAALDKAKAADDATTALKANKDATPQQRLDAAKASLEARNAVTKLRTDALAKDAKVKAAKADYDAANAELTKLHKEFDDSIKDNPDLASAKQAWDDAKAKAKDADDKVADANKNVADQRAAREAALAEQKKIDREYAQQKNKMEKENKR